MSEDINVFSLSEEFTSCLVWDCAEFLWWVMWLMMSMVMMPIKETFCWGSTHDWNMVSLIVEMKKKKRKFGGDSSDCAETFFFLKKRWKLIFEFPGSTSKRKRNKRKETMNVDWWYWNFFYHLSFSFFFFKEIK